jgi:hypothetical protein
MKYYSCTSFLISGNPLRSEIWWILKVSRNCRCILLILILRFVIEVAKFS